MSKILKELAELIQAGIITEETAERINVYYVEKEKKAANPLVLVFGILGSLMVGLGIVLIIAHNWDDLSRPSKLFFALLPLLAGQLACAYTLFRRSESRAWRESSSVFLFFAISASISIVSQVYNIPGSLSGFLLTWMVLSIPIIYIMRAAMTSMLVIFGITAYACNKSYFDYPTEIAWYYWLMLASVLPFFIQLVRRGSKNFMYFHCWFVALSVLITLNMFGANGDSLYMFVAFMSLFCLYILLGEAKELSEGRTMSNAFLVIGSVGSNILLMILSFRLVWSEIGNEQTVLDAGFAVAGILTLAAVILLLRSARRGWGHIHPQAFLFLIFIPLFELGKVQPSITPWLVNLLVLAVAVVTTWRGAERDDMFVLNYGLIIMAVLILCRFFDTDMSFVVRGILFLMVGFSFFGANYWMLRRRKLNDV